MFSPKSSSMGQETTSLTPHPQLSGASAQNHDSNQPHTTLSQAQISPSPNNRTQPHAKLNQDLREFNVVSALEKSLNRGRNSEVPPLEPFLNNVTSLPEHLGTYYSQTQKPIEFSEPQWWQSKNNTNAIEAKQAQIRVESFNREVRERQLLLNSKRKEKEETLRRRREMQRLSREARRGRAIVQLDNESDTENESEHDDFFELMEQRKVKRKFNRLMSFNLEKDAISLHNETGKVSSSSRQLALNKLPAIDNMRMNQTRFKKAFADAAFAEAVKGQGRFGGADGSNSRRSNKQYSSRPLRVRFSIDDAIHDQGP